ncbi:MAG: hypothetical protein L3J91_02240, partial [Thermoplasmata archaeon]|nr:hypothetical protein [Thermoplasmata archaeon]
RARSSVAAPSDPPPPGPRPAAWIATWVAVVAVLLVIAGVAAWGTMQTPSSSAAPVPTGWMTFSQAAAIAQNLANRSVVGPWSISFAEGLAANGPWAPTLSGTFGPSAACVARLSGIGLFTYWNDSVYPQSRDATVFSSGAAPIWSFGYVDPSGDTEIISIVNGAGGYNGVWPSSSHCTIATGSSFRAGFSLASVADSPNVAARVQGLPMGTLTPSGGFPAIDPAHPGTAFELYTLGFASADVAGFDHPVAEPGGLHAPAWWDTWGRCGLPGESGRTPSVVVELNASSAAQAFVAGNAPTTCASIGVTGSLSAPSLGTLLSGNGSFEAWGLSIAPVTSLVPAPPGWNVLSTDALTPELWQNTSSGVAFDGLVPTGTAACGVGSPNLTACTANPLGWYAVLIDTHGHWLDSFPALAGGSLWTRTGISVTTGDTIELIVPSETVTVKEFSLAYTGPESSLGIAYLSV